MVEVFKATYIWGGQHLEKKRDFSNDFTKNKSEIDLRYLSDMRVPGSATLLCVRHQ